MFRQMAIGDQLQREQRAMALFQQHPEAIANQLEVAWQHRTIPPNVPFAARPGLADIGANPPTLLWDHLIYAYMVENTRILDIFRRIVSEFVHGERLEIPSEEGQRWLRITEELFFREAPSFQIFTLTSRVRSDETAQRREAYFRMFGLDLNHGTEDNKPYPYVKPAAANREFLSTLEALLMETWTGLKNAGNISGPRDTDDAAIANAATRLQDMLVNRRRNGNLSREEFWYVATMSWFHLTVEFNAPIVHDLSADSTATDERLRKLGERVGLPAHGKSHSFLRLADLLSVLLRDVEAGLYSDTARAALLYASPASSMMYEIISHYAIATGRDLKARSVAVTAR